MGEAVPALRQLLQQKRFADAEKEARALLVGASDDPFVVQALAMALVQQGNLDEAVAELRHGVGKHPSDVALRYNLACLYQKQGDSQAARQGFEEALKLDPSHAKAQQALDALGGASRPETATRPRVGTREHQLDAQERRRRLDEESVRVGREILEAEERKSSRLTLVASAVGVVVLAALVGPWLWMRMQPPEVRATVWFDKADKLIEEGHVLNASEEIRRGLELDPDSCRGLHLSGMQGLATAGQLGIDDLFKGGLATELTEDDMKRIRNSTQALRDCVRIAQEREENPIPAKSRNKALAECHMLLFRGCMEQSSFDAANKKALETEAFQHVEAAAQLDPANTEAQKILEARKAWDDLLKALK